MDIERSENLKQKTLNILKKDRFESIKDKYDKETFISKSYESKEEFFNRIEGGNK